MYFVFISTDKGISKTRLGRRSKQVTKQAAVDNKTAYAMLLKVRVVEAKITRFTPINAPF